jgi:hypothetical protein
MTALSAPTLKDVPVKLRPLRGLEHLFWAVDKINGFNFGIAITFRGAVAHSRWKDAFAQVQRRHPLVDAGINEDEALKTVEFPPQPDSLVVESVWGPSVMAGYEGEHFIGSTTFDGALHLVYSSFTPISGLLKAIEEKLTTASTDTSLTGEKC